EAAPRQAGAAGISSRDCDGKRGQACESAGRRRRAYSPTVTEPVNSDPTGTKPRTRCLARAARPAEAMQPQCEQSGAPPNWHGVMRVSRSAEMLVVVRANTQSSGEAGGFA